MKMMKLGSPVKFTTTMLPQIGELPSFVISITYEIINNQREIVMLYDRLLDREQVGGEETTVEDDEDDGFLKAFKVFLLNVKP